MSGVKNGISETPMSQDWRQWQYHTGHVVESVFSLISRDSVELDTIIESRSEIIGDTREERWSRPGD